MELSLCDYLTPFSLTSYSSISRALSTVLSMMLLGLFFYFMHLSCKQLETEYWILFHFNSLTQLFLIFT